jgi:lysophospholipase L1-like esterase
MADAGSITPLPRWKRSLFLAITLALPLVALGLVEVVLRLFGWGGYPAFIREIGEVEPGSALCMVEPDASRPYFFANPTRPGYADQTSFRMPKPAGTFRVFLFGESAAKGYPQPRNLSMASFLEAMLEDAMPGRDVEVIDLGTTAVASFPIVYMAREALAYQPDLFVLYVGNNEFFGAYGTASINASGTWPPAMLPFVRAARGLALVQVIDWVFRRDADADRTLMEEMIGQTVIPSDSPLRTAAAMNLRTHLARIIDAASGAGVPVIACTTASNESGLAPLGDGPDAPAAFAEGRAHAAAGDRAAARMAFLRARDLDTMPWRPTSGTEDAIRAAATDGGAALCDIADRFRSMTTEAATGWDLLDDHVHLSVRGQAEAARAILDTLAGLPGLPGVTPERLAALPGWEVYAQRLGANPWDDYRVHHTLRVLFGVPFMKRSNREAFERFDQLCREAEARMSPAELGAAREWQTSTPHAGGMRPITGMVARVLLREGRAGDAAPLYAIAARQVPRYTSWQLEYTYFLLACRERVAGALTEEERAAAAEAIADGRFLLQFGHSSTGLTERYVGRLHQLRGEWAEAIPYLLDARPRMAAEDLVACDQALITSYLRCGRTADARALAERGIRESGRFAGVYRQLLEQVMRAGAGGAPG